MERFRTLATKWQTVATGFKLYGDAQVSAVLEKVADELLHEVNGWEHELIGLREAAAYAGVHEDTVGRWIHTGTLPNLGRDNAPKTSRNALDTRRRQKARKRIANQSTSFNNAAELLRGIID